MNLQNTKVFAPMSDTKSSTEMGSICDWSMQGCNGQCIHFEQHVLGGSKIIILARALTLSQGPVCRKLP